MVENKNRNTYK